MIAALSVGRVGGLAVALGVGAAILYGSAAASAEVAAGDSAERPAATGTATANAAPASRPRGRSALAPAPAVGAPGPVRPAAVNSGRVAARVAAPVVPGDREPSADQAGLRASTGLLPVTANVGLAATGAVASPAPPTRTAAAVVEPVPAVATAEMAPIVAAVSDPATLPAAGAGTAAAAAEPAVAPDPLATVSTAYGELGKWMLRDGQIANWVDLPLCDPAGDCKTVQEPINMVFVVEASSRWGAQLRLDHSLRKAKFGPSPFSSIGYSGIVDGVLSGQMPHGGIFGFGLIPPLPFDLGSGPGLIPLLAPFGFGAAYRDAPFWEANAHLRTFGGTTTGDGRYIFTASVSDEYLISTGGLLPTHAYESFVDARAALAANMVAIGATGLGTIDMQNAISASDPDFTTGDHDGYAVVIGIAPRTVAPNPIRRKERGAAVRNPASV